MKLFRKVKIGTRLYAMFAFLVVALLFIAYSGVTSRIELISDTQFMQENYIECLSTIAEVNVTTGNLFLSYRNYYLEYPDQEKMQVRLNDINDRTSFILTSLQDYQKSLQNRNAPQEELDSASKAVAKIQNEVVPFNEKLTGLIQSGQMDEAHSLIISKELRTLRSELQDDLITGIYNDCMDNANAVLNDNISGMKASNTRILVLVAVGFVIAVFFSSMSVRSVVNPISQLMLVSKEITMGKIDVDLPEISNDEIGELTKQFESLVHAGRKQAELIQRIAKGDLSDNYTPRSDVDVVGHSLVEMLERNNSALTQILASSNQLAEASREISTGSQTLAQGATEQAAAIEELSATVNEITGMIHDGSKMVDKAADLSVSIKGSAEKGNRQMDQMVEAIKDIRNASTDINKIMKVIDDIAFQTNILALNAAVEAARAGQHGKGFAVVADEVRNLASKSAAAAKDTDSLITDTMEKAELGVRITNETAVSLAEIVQGINENGQIISDIAAEHKKQETAIDQINTSINQVAQVVHQNSATAEESAAASAEMTAQTDVLNESIAAFKLKGTGNSFSRQGRVIATASAGQSLQGGFALSVGTDGTGGKY